MTEENGRGGGRPGHDIGNGIVSSGSIWVWVRGPSPRARQVSQGREPRAYKQSQGSMASVGSREDVVTALCCRYGGSRRRSTIRLCGFGRPPRRFRGWRIHLTLKQSHFAGKDLAIFSQGDLHQSISTSALSTFSFVRDATRTRRASGVC